MCTNIGVFPDSHLDNFYPQKLVLDPQKLGASVLSDAYMINPKLILLIYGFVFISIDGLMGHGNGLPLNH